MADRLPTRNETQRATTAFVIWVTLTTREGNLDPRARPCPFPLVVPLQMAWVLPRAAAAGVLRRPPPGHPGPAAGRLRCLGGRPQRCRLRGGRGGGALVGPGPSLEFPLIQYAQKSAKRNRPQSRNNPNHTSGPLRETKPDNENNGKTKAMRHKAPIHAQGMPQRRAISAKVNQISREKAPVS